MKLENLVALVRLVENEKDSCESKSFDIPFSIGENYFIRTVTYHTIGKIKAIYGNFLVLENASWIADSGRWHDALKDATNLSEIEPFVDDVIISLNAIVDATKWNHSLNIGQK